MTITATEPYLLATFPAAGAIAEGYSMRLPAVWVINALALLLVVYLLKGIYVNGSGFTLIAALVPGLINTLIHPIPVILTPPVMLLTLGLLIFIISALPFLFVGNLLAGFQMASFGAVLLGSILYSVISRLLSSLLLREA